ncbi:MAG: hypothetical protein KGH60_02560 [Candidatus Micrarchaeota archaeon]|nr:hypothetical protein [Candidatus Micrarchaeota archaeon]
MFGFRHRDKEAEDESKRRKPVLSERERKIVYIGATVILVAAALVSLLAQSAVRSNGVNGCSGIILQQQRDSCYNQFAIATKNITACGAIAGAALRSSCSSTVAESLSTPGLCGKAGQAGYSYSNCVINITLSTGHAAYCSLLNGTLASTCAYDLAVQQKFANLTTCYGIANSTLMDSCMGTYYYNSAILHGSASYCGRIPGSSNSSILGSILSQGSNYSNPEQYVIYSSINVSPRNYCYYRIATATLNRSVCSSTSGLLSTLCNDTFITLNSTAQSYNVTTACGSLPGYLQDICNYGVASQLALANKNVSYCASLQGTTYRYSCITTLASSLRNATYCSYIPNTTVSQACVNSAINATNSTHA